MIVAVKSALCTEIVYLFVAILSTSCDEMIYILEWTSAAVEPLNYLGTGQEPFVSRNCSFKTCYLTDNRLFFNSVLDFDVLLFNAVYLNDSTYIPPKRSERQEYVLIGLEPAGIYQIPAIFNNFFNLTCTYKLSSDVAYPYLIVKNNLGAVVGPKENMNWRNDMKLTNDSILAKLSNKSIAAAWIASNCENAGDRLTVVKNLERELAQYGHSIDIYGKCGKLPCPRGKRMSECLSNIETKYYFYLAFENSLCEDYVTEKVLHALQHFAVPIVYGGANYTRFLPNGTYLNANEIGVQNLAKEMNDIILNVSRYYDFFKWHGYYTFHNSEEDGYRDAVCGFCTLLNNKTRRDQRYAYKDIVKWWDGIDDKVTNNVVKNEANIKNEVDDGSISSWPDYFFGF